MYVQRHFLMRTLSGSRTRSQETKASQSARLQRKYSAKRNHSHISLGIPPKYPLPLPSFACFHASEKFKFFCPLRLSALLRMFGAAVTSGGAGIAHLAPTSCPRCSHVAAEAICSRCGLVKEAGRRQMVQTQLQFSRVPALSMSPPPPPMHSTFTSHERPTGNPTPQALSNFRAPSSSPELPRSPVRKPENLPACCDYDVDTISTWIFPINDEYATRDYQVNIVSSALLRNTMVVLPTGLGKTFIAAVVMYNYLRWFPRGKVRLRLVS